MPTALQLRLRAPWLEWRPFERRLLLLQARRYIRPSFLLSEEARAVKEPSAAITQEVEKPHGPKKQSLLEELFPEEAHKSHDKPKRGRERDIPRLDVRSTVPKTPRQKRERDSWWSTDTTKAPGNWWSVDKANKKLPKPDKAKQQVMGVLMLRNASKALAEVDFTRLIPQGLHIEGWQLDQADILKVIAGRDTSTLEQLNFYFILFNSRASMNAYRTHVLRLHTLAAKHVQSSLTSPIPPPPGYLIQGQDVDAVLQSYALVPPSQHLNLIPMPNELPPSLAVIVRHRGYPAIVNGPLKEPFIVIMRLEGPQLSLHMIKSVLKRSESKRRLPWDRAMKELNCAVWVPEGKNISPLDPRSRLGNDDQGDEKGWKEWKREKEGEKESNDDVKRPRPIRKPKAVYLIGFHSEDKAQEFVRYWHRRPVDIDDFTYEDDEIPPIVHAEMVW